MAPGGRGLAPGGGLAPRGARRAVTEASGSFARRRLQWVRIAQLHRAPLASGGLDNKSGWIRMNLSGFSQPGTWETAAHHVRRIPTGAVSPRFPPPPPPPPPLILPRYLVWKAPRAFSTPNVGCRARHRLGPVVVRTPGCAWPSSVALKNVVDAFNKKHMFSFKSQLAIREFSVP